MGATKKSAAAAAEKRGGAGAGKQAAAQEAKAYDFRRPHRVSRERLRTLEAMYEQVVKTLEGWLISRMRGHLEIKLRSVDQFTYSEFIEALSTPCAAYLVDINGPDGPQGIINFGQDFAAFMVERLFGGSGGPVDMKRPLTPIERMAVRGIAERTIHLLSEAWRDHVPLEMRVSGFESIPEILVGANNDELVLVATLEAIVAEKKSLVLISLPFGVLDSFFSSTQESRFKLPSGTPEMREQNEASVRATEVNVSARLPQFKLAMRDLASLKVGAVLNTGISRDEEIDVLVNGQPRFRAGAGRAGSKLALRITADLAESNKATKSPQARTA